MLTRYYGYNEEVFIFGVPVKINSFSPIPEDDEELSLPELIYWASLGDLEQVKQLLIDGEDLIRLMMKGIVLCKQRLRMII